MPDVKRIEMFKGLVDAIDDALALLPNSPYSMSTHELRLHVTLTHMRVLAIDIIDDERKA